MGINRGSLYATFGDKRTLFLSALRQYDAIHRARWIEGLSKSPSPRQAITGAFDSIVAATIDGGSRDGCLLVNTALELSPHDPEVAAIVATGFAEMEGFFRTAIERGQAIGEVARDLDAVATARALLSLFIGLRVLSRSRPEPDLMRSVAAQADALLGP